MSDASWLGPRIDVRPLLAKQQSVVLTLLKQLDTDDWARPTICPGWTIHDVAARQPTRWAITRSPQPNADASVVLDQDTAWRLCTRGISPNQAARQAHIEGNQQHTDATLRVVSIIY